MASSDCMISIVAPLLNDSEIVEPFLAELFDVLRQTYSNYEIVLVDDGSTDNTIDTVVGLFPSYEGIRLIRLSRKFGREVAITAGLESVIGDYVVVMLPDSDPPSLIPEMVERARQGAGSVLGVRKDGRSEGLLLRVASGIFHWYCHRFLKLKLPRNSAFFRVLNRQSVNAVIQIKDRLRHLRAFSAYVGYASQEISYEPISRREKPASRGLFETVDLGISVIVANSAQPLRLVSGVGLAISGLSALYAVFVLVARLFVETLPPGWATRSIYSSIMFFFLFLILTVLCEYVGRILAEIQDRPLYYVLDEKNSIAPIVDDGQKNVVTRSVDT